MVTQDRARCYPQYRINRLALLHTREQVVFTALINRSKTPTRWQKIPWDDPDFSRRMLAEHLTQAHDLASRRLSIIDQHVRWIHHAILHEQPAKLLDLGCGPGFYSRRLSALGHMCTGIDFSPASIAYAREQDHVSAYVHGSVLDVEYGSGYDLVLLIYGELNAFSPEDAEDIVQKAYAALKPGGKLLLEVHPAGLVERVGQEAPSWYTAEQGLFSDQPYLCLTEAVYDGSRAISNHYVFAAESGAMQQYTSMLQRYTDDDYRALLDAFATVTFFPSLDGGSAAGDLFVIVAEKAAG